MKTTTRFFLVLAIAILLAGCATNNFIKMEGANVQGGNVLRHPTIKPELPEVDLVGKDGSLLFPTDAYLTLGIFKTEALSKGKVTCIEAEIPKVKFGELIPGSVSVGRCIAVVDNNLEIFCQSRIYWRDGDPNLKLLLAIEGTSEQVRKSKIMIPSMLGETIFNLSGKEYIAPVNFSNGTERRAFVSKNGTLGETRPLIDPGYIRNVLSWRQVSTPFGILLTPLSKERVDKIAEMNPRYKFMDRWIDTGEFELTTDPIGTVIGNALDALIKSTAPTTGLDFNSKLPSRRHMGLNMAYFLNLQDEIRKSTTTQVATEAGKSKAPQKAEVKPARVSAPAKAIAKAEQLTVSAWVKAMAQKIFRLGVPETTALALAQKIERRDFSPEKIKSPIIARAIWKEGKKEIGHGTFSWSNGYVFENGERYEVDGIILYRFMNGGLEVLYV